MYPGRPPQNQGPGGPPMVQYPGMYYKSTPPAASPWPPIQTAPASSAPGSNYVQYPSKYTATSSAHSATRSALAESYERIRNEMRGLKGESKSSHQPAPPAPTMKQKNDPLTSLCSNTSVSLSSLLEAAMAPNAGSSKRTTEDPIMKKTILGKCERKIAQLYRDRITGMGSFFPLIEANTTTIGETNDLLRHCPRLEFNSDAVGAPWICPDVTIEQKKLVPPKPAVMPSQTIETVGSHPIQKAPLTDTSVPPPGMEAPSIELSEPSINLITDMTFEKWAEIEREKRQHERELQWEKLMFFTGSERKSVEKEGRRRSKRNRRSQNRSSSRSRSKSRSKSRRRRSSSRSRNRSRKRNRSRSRSRRHRSSSFSLSPSPSPQKRGESRRSRDSPPSRKPPLRDRRSSRDRTTRRSPPSVISSQPPAQAVSSWPGPYSTPSAQPQPTSFPYGPGSHGEVLPEYSSAIEYSHPPSNYLVPRHPSWPYNQPGIRMPFRPYGPRPGYSYPAPGLRPPGMGPWPGSIPGLPYRIRPPRGLCANPNLITVSDPPAPGTGPFQQTPPEIIVIDDYDNTSPNSPMHPPGLSPEIKTRSDPPGGTDCLRMQCFSHLSRIQKVHQDLHLLQRRSTELKDIIHDMEAENREFHGVFAMIDGFLCKMEINERSGAAFKVVLPSSGITSILWDIHGAYHDYTKEDLLSLFEDLFCDSRNLTYALSSVFDKCARCVGIARQKDRHSRDKADLRSRLKGNSGREHRSHETRTGSRERENRHRRHEPSDRSRRRSRDSARKSRTPEKHSKERAIRSSSRKSRSPRKHSKERKVRDESRKSRSPQKHSKESTGRSTTRKSRSPGKHSKERSARSTSRKSRSPRKHSKERKGRDESRRSRSPGMHKKEQSDRDALKKSSPNRKKSEERSEEKSVKKSTSDNPEEKRNKSDRRENGVEDNDSIPLKGLKLEKVVEKTLEQQSNAPNDADLPKIDKAPVSTVPNDVKEQQPKDKNSTTAQRPKAEKNEAKINAGSRSNKAEDFKTRVRQVQSAIESLKKQIDDLEGPARQTDEPSLLMKAGMLCRRLTINEKTEIKIVVTPEILPNMIQIVHTMAPVHAPAQKTVVVYKKHFTPMDDIDAVVAKVLDSCDTCKPK